MKRLGCEWWLSATLTALSYHRLVLSSLPRCLAASSPCRLIALLPCCLAASLLFLLKQLVSTQILSRSLTTPCPRLPTHPYFIFQNSSITMAQQGSAPHNARYVAASMLKFRANRKSTETTLRRNSSSVQIIKIRRRRTNYMQLSMTFNFHFSKSKSDSKSPWIRGLEKLGSTSLSLPISPKIKDPV